MKQIVKKQSGFTLLEIMVVVIIIGILAGAVVPQIMKNPDKANMARANTDVNAIQTALDLYRLDNFNYPSSDQGLDALVSKPTGGAEARNWSGPYLKSVPKDPWGNDFGYVFPGEKSEVDVFSYGRDGAPGGEGVDADIGNWDS